MSISAGHTAEGIELMEEIRKELHGRKVLIVDDNRDERKTLREQLEEVGMQVVGEAANGEEAVRLADNTDPSLVIMDIRLDEDSEKKPDGIDIAKQINDREPRPILLLSGYSDGELIRRAKLAGVITYLVKPVTLKELLPSIVLTMDRFKEMTSLKAMVDDMKETLANRKVIEQAKGLLMERKGLSERDAFSYLRKKSQDENKPMAEIARSLVMLQDVL